MALKRKVVIGIDDREIILRYSPAETIVPFMSRDFVSGSAGVELNGNYNVLEQSAQSYLVKNATDRERGDKCVKEIIGITEDIQCDESKMILTLRGKAVFN